MTVVPATIAANGAASAASAARHASEERRAECVALDKAFASAGATVEAKRHYAQCVHLLYTPSEREHGYGAAVGLAVLVAVAAAILGSIMCDMLSGRCRR